MLHASACAMAGALLEFAIQSLCRRLVVRCVRFDYPRSGKIVAPAIDYFASMSASEIHEIRPGCLMLPPLHFPVRVWPADGSREAAVWTARSGGLASRLSRFVGRRCFSAGLISPAKLRSKYLMDPSWTPFIGTPYAVIATLIGAYLGGSMARRREPAGANHNPRYDFVAPVYFLRAHVRQHRAARIKG
jgi:hypothetical protein